MKGAEGVPSKTKAMTRGIIYRLVKMANQSSNCSTEINMSYVTKNKEFGTKDP